MNTVKVTVITDRVTIYKDFAINLTHYLFKYYDDDGSFGPEDNRNFHKWCYLKVCDEFKEEGLDFSSNTKLENVFFEYFEKYFFSLEIKMIDAFIRFWNNFFDVFNQKNINIQSMMLDFYLLFNESVENNILSNNKYESQEVV